MSIPSKKICVVTGAAGRIGRAIVNRFSEDGFVVVAVDILDGGVGDSVICDLSQPDKINELETYLKAKYGAINVLINNGALGGHRGPLHEKSVDEYEKVMSVNVRAPFLLSQAALRLQQGTDEALSIINICSMAGSMATPLASVYSISKHALNGLTRNIAVEYATQNVRCNSISPGVMDVPNIQGFDATAFEAMLNQTPMRRVGRAEEVADLAAYLASEKATFITGADFKIDGGRTA